MEIWKLKGVRRSKIAKDENEEIKTVKVFRRIDTREIVPDRDKVDRPNYDNEDDDEDDGDDGVGDAAGEAEEEVRQVPLLQTQLRRVACRASPA